MDTKVALVTGASSGIGEATARKLKELGYTVYGAARRVERMQQLAGAGIRTLAMDVTNDASMQAGCVMAERCWDPVCWAIQDYSCWIKGRLAADRP